jgi:hypothetical protein
MAAPPPFRYPNNTRRQDPYVYLAYVPPHHTDSHDGRQYSARRYVNVPSVGVHAF